jgi:hypothetical protein
MITALVLTLNEESDIAECLTSVRWCDDVRVLDPGGTDMVRKKAWWTGRLNTYPSTPMFPSEGPIYCVAGGA